MKRDIEKFLVNKKYPFFAFIFFFFVVKTRGLDYEHIVEVKSFVF